MANPYIPRKDAKARIWMESFASGITNDCGRYMLSPAQAQSIQSVVDAFIQKLSIATNPATRTRATIMDKQDSRKTAENLIQMYYTLIKFNRGIDDGDKIAIGVRPINPARKKINCPQSCPKVAIIANTPGVQTLSIGDSMNTESKAKPFGATHFQLMRVISDRTDGPPKRDDARLVGEFTRPRVSVQFDQAEDGRKATYWARWVSRRGETGPWSLPASMSIAA